MKMSKSASSTHSQDDNDTYRQDLTGEFDDTETVVLPIDLVDVVEVPGPPTKGKGKVVPFDEYAPRCFIVEALEPPNDVKIKTETPGVFISKKVFNLETFDPIGTRRITTAWEDHAVKLYRWFLRNWNGPTTVFMWPSSESLTTIGSDNYISTDASSFLQFTFHDATPQQNAFHACAFACGLTTTIPNRKASQLILHPKALPSVMDWPSNVNFKVSGKLIKKPAEWNTTPTKAALHADYDFDTISPVKKFKFTK